MTMLIVYALTLACILTVVIYIAKSGGYTKVPFLIAAVYLGWLLPQFYAYDLEATFDRTMLLPLVLYSSLSFAMIVAGWAFVRLRMQSNALDGTSDMQGAFQEDQGEQFLRPVLAPLIILTLFQIGVQFYIFSLPSAMLTSRTPSGIITILRFLSDAKVVSFVLSVLIFLRHRNGLTLCLLAGNVLLYAPSILLQIKRNELIEFAFVLICCLWFDRRQTMPRVVLLGGIVSALLLVSSVTELREISGFKMTSTGDLQVKAPSLTDLSQIDLTEGLSENFGGNFIEVRNAVYYMRFISDGGLWTYGAQAWNRLVTLYVPAQFVGSGTKRSLLAAYDLYDFEFSSNFYERQRGSTLTGFLQSYADFSFFGVLVYFVLGGINAYNYTRSLRGSKLHQLLYVSMAIATVVSFTHDSYFYLTRLVFIYPLVLLLIKTTYPRLKSSAVSAAQPALATN